MVLAYIPSWNHGNIDNLAVANNDGGVRLLIGWDKLPEDKSASAKHRYYLALYSRETTEADDAGNVEIYPIVQDWPEQTAWEAQPKINDSVDPIAAPFVPKRGWKLFDVTSIVRRPDSAPSFGAMLKFNSEDQSGAKRNWSGYAVVSREGLGEWVDLRPRLLVVEPASTE